MHLDPNYGVASVQYAPMVAKAINTFDVRHVLDYGAGKLRLIKTISDGLLVDHKFLYAAYEPSNPEYANPPDPAEMVVCIDVLEHIEPECLNDVLDDLQRLTNRLGFFTVHCGPAKKILDDGRNAHLTQEPMGWWLPKLCSRFDVQTVQKTEGGFWTLVAAK